MTSDPILRDMLRDFDAKQQNERFVNDFWRSVTNAQRQLCQWRGWGFLMEINAEATLTADTRYVALASDFGRLINDHCVRDTTNGNYLERITMRQAEDEYYEDGSSTGEVDKFWIVNQTMYFTPIPDSADTVKYSYFKKPSAVTANSNTLLVPEDYQELLTLMTKDRLIKLGHAPIMDVVVTKDDIQELRYEAMQDDIARYREIRANLKRRTRKMRY